MATKLVEDLTKADTVRIEWFSDHRGWQDLNCANIYLLSAGLRGTRIGKAVGAVIDFENCYDDTSYRLVYLIGNTNTTTKQMTVTKLVSTMIAWGLDK